MSKKQFFVFLFLIFLILSIFLLLIVLEFQSSKVNESPTVSTNTLNLGQPSETMFSQVFFCPEDNCQEVIVSLVQDANKTIDCAVYDLSSKEISDALINKRLDGVNIRIVTDNGRSSTKASQVGILKESGISVLISPTENSYMHNKFCVFDGNKVLIGSTNFTDTSFFESYNNIIVFKNQTIAETLIGKIDSFYSGQFSKDALFFGKDFGDIEIYFCPTDNCIQQVQEELNLAKESIECMMYSFTLTEFTDSIIQSKEKGIETKIILENQQISQYSEYQRLRSEGIDIILDNQSKLMHNKYCIIDEYTVLTGSMNFSFNGTNNNDETIVIIHNPEIAIDYKENFYSYWNVWKNLVN